MFKERGMIVTVILFVIALGFAGYGTFRYFQEKSIYDDLVKSCTAEADGIVESCESHVVTSHKRVSKHHTKTVKTTYYLTKVSFEADGKQYICEYDSTVEFPVNSMTTVKYDPSDPDKSYLGSNPVNTYSSHLRTILVGAVLAVAGVVTIFKKGRFAR